MITITQLKKVNTREDAEALGLGRLIIDISYRGGGVGFSGSAVASHFKIDTSDLPRNFGAACNYLGGGVRGAITGSGFNRNLPERKVKLLTALQDAMVRVYESIEDENSLNDEVDEDGEINWDAKATNLSRNAGIVSAY